MNLQEWFEQYEEIENAVLEAANEYYNFLNDYLDGLKEGWYDTPMNRHVRQMLSFDLPSRQDTPYSVEAYDSERKIVHVAYHLYYGDPYTDESGKWFEFPLDYMEPEKRMNVLMNARIALRDKIMKYRQNFNPSHTSFL